MRAGKLCSHDVAIATPDESLLVAARRMADQDVHELIVVDDRAEDHPVGVISEHDFVRALARGTVPPDVISVRDVMHTDVVTVCEDEGLDEAYDKMTYTGARTMPVVDRQDHLQGVIALDAVVAARRTSGVMLRSLGGGVLGGIFAGAVLAALMVVSNVVQGDDAWVALKRAGYPFLGDPALAPGFDQQAVLIGIAAHLGVAAFWGGLFGMLLYGASRATTVFAGLLWGIVVWLGMFRVVLPMIHLHAMLPTQLAIVTHVVFGGLVAIGFLPFQRNLRVPTTAFAAA